MSEMDKENTQQSQQQNTHEFMPLHNKNLPKKGPPHLRQLNVYLSLLIYSSSPSDKIRSPCTQKLMQDRMRAAEKYSFLMF